MTTVPLVILVDPARRHIVNAVYLSGKETAKQIEKMRAQYAEEAGTAPPYRIILDGSDTPHILDQDRDLPVVR